MIYRISKNPAFRREAVVGVACVFLALGVANLSVVRAQSATADWEKAAGGKMSFDVASVKQNSSGYPPEGVPPRSNFPLDSGNGYSLNGGLFAATNWPLYSYVGFAYKLTPTALRDLRRQLPKWAATDHFDIQARARGNPTKDQMRLMMQSLLADRFKLVVHRESKQMAVYGLILEKPGKTGRQLVAHSEARPCTVINDPSSSAASGAGELPFCGSLTGKLENGHMHVESRGITMAQVADYLPSIGMTLDRPVLDRTQLGGTYDFTLEWTPDDMTVAMNGVRLETGENGQGFVSALRDELGLKLEPTTGAVDATIIDHIEEPSPN
jgi:uncharacterized protein (TIGR03435 family)